MRSFERSLPMALLRARESVMEFFRPHLKAHGLTEQQWRVIRALHSHGEMEFQGLARRICVQPPSLTGILTRLEKLHLIRRRRAADDRRRLFVSITKEGAKRFEAVSELVEGVYHDIEQQFGERRLNTLFKLLTNAQQLQRPAGTPAAKRAGATRRNSKEKTG